MFNTPILLITFNRPLHTRRVLEVIRAQQPKQLFVFQDGARDGNEIDAVKCAEVRNVVKELVDWDCNLQTYYSEINLGCGAGPMTGIDWFFSNVDRGIVMEDDCLAHPDFFEYCEELLEKYNDNKQVAFINSTLYDDRWNCEESYGFSRYMVTGAWASWASVWNGFDLDLLSLNAKRFRKHCVKLLQNKVEADWWYFKVLEIQQDKSKKSYWDYQMQIHLFLHNAVTIHPKRNLISNIGFDAEGTHTLSNDGRGDKEVYPILPLKHPVKIKVDVNKDAYCFAKAHTNGFIKDKISFLYRSMLWSQGLGHQLLRLYKKMIGKTL